MHSYSSGVRHSPLVLLPLMRLLLPPLSVHKYEAGCNDIWQGKIEGLRDEPAQRRLTTTEPTWTILAMKPVLLGENPAINRLSCVLAAVRFICYLVGWSLCLGGLSVKDMDGTGSVRSRMVDLSKRNVEHSSSATIMAVLCTRF
jgi:hypothetical protein